MTTTKFDQLPADRLEGATEAVQTLMAVAGREIMTPALTGALADWGVKRCKGCKQVRHTEEFGRDTATSDGLNGQCRPCARERGRRYYADNYTSTRRAPLQQQEGLTEFDLPFATSAVNGVMNILGADRVSPRAGEVLTAWRVKRCPSCTQVKHPESFNRNTSNPGGLESECRECQRERSRRYAAEHREECRERTTVWRADNQIRRRLYSGKVRAERAGAVAEEITEEELLQYWENRGIDPSRCYYTGVELTPQNISLDHCTPFKRGGGHALGNIVPCTWASNDRKNTMTAEEFQELLATEQETNTND